MSEDQAAAVRRIVEYADHKPKCEKVFVGWRGNEYFYGDGGPVQIGPHWGEGRGSCASRPAVCTCGLDDLLAVLSAPHETARPAPDEGIGLDIDMLDADRLREWARLILLHGSDISHWGDRFFVASKLQTLATCIEKTVRDVGVLRRIALDGPAGGARGEADARERDAGTPQSTGTSQPCGHGWHWGAKCDDPAKPEAGPMRNTESPSGVQALESSGSSLHRCSGCGHRWDGPLHGAELCGDCWRKAQGAALAAPPDEQEPTAYAKGRADALRDLASATRKMLTQESVAMLIEALSFDQAAASPAPAPAEPQKENR